MKIYGVRLWFVALMDINVFFCDFLGYTKEEMTGMALKDISHPDDIGKNIELGRKLLAGEIDSYSLEKNICVRTVL